MKMDEQTTSEKCEYLMNIVVESRKQFSKMCIDYEQKTSLVENKMLKLRLKTIGNCRFKPKTIVPNIDIEQITKDLDNFTEEVSKTQRRVNNLKKNITDTQTVVLQLKNDVIGKRLQKKITADGLLSEAKSKMNK